MTETQADQDVTGKTIAWSVPFALFGTWLDEAHESEPNDPTAMALATVDPEGRPSNRMVLLKGWSENGFIFYTNLESKKGQDLEKNRAVSLLFHWKSLRRQVRIDGMVEPVSEAEADEYFASRPKGSQIGAWASRQSRPMKARLEFEKEIARYTGKFAVGAVPRPDFWSGYLVRPLTMEFWRDRKFRLHERRQFSCVERGQKWQESVLYP